MAGVDWTVFSSMFRHLLLSVFSHCCLLALIGYKPGVKSLFYDKGHFFLKHDRISKCFYLCERPRVLC